MINSDKTIKKQLSNGEGVKISPLPELRDIQPASVDLAVDLSRGAYLFEKYLNEDGTEPRIIWRKNERVIPNYKFVEIKDGEDLVIKPGQKFICSTIAYLDIPADKVVMVNGKSSLGRIFVTVHQTAGFMDPGFDGHVTLEIKNDSDFDFVLGHGAPICQIVIADLDQKAENPYGSKALDSRYKGQVGPTVSRAEPPKKPQPKKPAAPKRKQK